MTRNTESEAPGQSAHRAPSSDSRPVDDTAPTGIGDATTTPDRADNTANLNNQSPHPVGGARMGAVVGRPYRERSTLEAGDVLQQRFKILRFIARGGAGEVYEAFDLELSCPVALKIVRPDAAQDEVAIDRFRREIALARQVTHPNVSRIFDVFRHELPALEAGRPAMTTLFLTMELLVGESLSQRIQRQGPIPLDEALAIIVDMVEGLKAAHRAGIVHRDFKSANVMLARQGDAVRAVITDFGLARSESSEKSEMTNTGIVVGTPYYMAPEQLTGGEVTPAADIYALGVVIYEMITAKRPFTGSNEISTAIKRLTQAPPSPRLFAANLPANWERAILRCLEVDLNERIGDLDELVGLLAGSPRPAEVPLPEPIHRAAPRISNFFLRRWLPALLILILLAAGGRQRLSRQTGVLSLAAAAQDRNETPLFVFTQLTPNEGTSPSWIGQAMVELTAAEFERRRELDTRVLSPQERLSYSGSDPSRRSEASPLQLSNRWGATLVTGTYSFVAAGDQLLLDYRITDDLGTRSRTIETSLEDPIDDVRAVVQGVLDDLGVARDEDRSSPLQLRRGAQRALGSQSLPAARWLLEQTVDQGGDAVATARLARTLWRLGETEEGRFHLRSAVGASSKEARDQELIVQAIRAEMDGDLELAERIWGALFQFFPENKEFGYEQLRLLIESNRLERARSDLAAVARLPPSADPRLELLAARLSAQTETAERYQQTAAAALELARRSGSDGLIGAALLEAARAAAAANEPDRAFELADLAAQAFQRLGDRAAAEQARALTRLLR